MNKTKIAEQYDRLKARTESIRKKGKKTIEQTVSVLEVGASSFGFAYARGRMGDAQGRLLIAGVDADLLAGLGLIGVGISGLLDDASDHAVSFGNGAWACYLAHKGHDLGYQAKQKAPPKTAGALNPEQPHIGADGFARQYANAA